MAFYQIGEAEALLGVKAHVLRYWEKEISQLSPRKDSFGRRIYSSADLSLLLRLKHLLYERRFTIEGAKEELLLSATRGADLRALSDAVRAALLPAYFASRSLSRTAETALGRAGRMEAPSFTDGAVVPAGGAAGGSDRGEGFLQ